MSDQPDAKTFPQAASPDLPTPEAVAAFLRAHPDFLSDRPELLSVITPPRTDADSGGSVVDFQAFMVERLRSQNKALANQRREIVATARENLHNQGRIHRSILFLLDAPDFEQFLQALTADLALLLDLDVVALVVEGGERTVRLDIPQRIRIAAPGSVRYFTGGQKVALYDHLPGDPMVFGEFADLVRSQLFVRLDISRSAPPAMLVFGTRDEGFFQPGQGTELIEFMAGVIERCLRAWLDLSA